MDEMIKSIKAALYDRATSPLVGSFVVAWLLWNYDFVLAFFSNEELSYKLDYIHTFIFGNWIQCLLNGFLIPSFAVYVYHWWLHKISIRVFRKATKNNQELIEAKKTLEKQVVMSLEESNEIRKQIDAIQNQTHIDNHEKEAKIKELNAELEARSSKEKELIKRLDNLNSKLESSVHGQNVSNKKSAITKNNIEPEISKDVGEVLVAIGDGNVSVSGILDYLSRKNINLHQARCLNYIEKLEELNLVKRNKYDHFSLTREGRDFLVDNNLDGHNYSS
ncbi:hypothetical protein [Hydrogenovibrio marinus]|uniref:Uncharacterized protein n=1 Tax=Hydrogenovibrio marinus TaxID=28885 RepID=A0A066ZYE9_HYDMR|nr:hypothetical protein [Hydrogenovibrio marinus]KDN95125.1 hypothetical protein EI16_02115 [Hydrogenovibrio marinus]BBN59598.1 hypothetical protein HVMH_1192 [Hydrogenovibrio marinus]